MIKAIISVSCPKGAIMKNTMFLFDLSGAANVTRFLSRDVVVCHICLIMTKLSMVYIIVCVKQQECIGFQLWRI